MGRALKPLTRRATVYRPSTNVTNGPRLTPYGRGFQHSVGSNMTEFNRRIAANEARKARILKTVRRWGAVRTAAGRVGRAAALAAEGVTAAEAAAVIAAPAVIYGAYKAGRAVKRRMTSGAPDSGNKRGAGPAPAGGSSSKRPRASPTDADDTVPVDPYQPSWPDDDPMDDPDDDDPKGGGGGGGRPDWSGNPGTHSCALLHNGYRSGRTRGSARIGSSVLRVTRPPHKPRLPLHNARRRCRRTHGV